jgi:hypothetical protein
VRPRGRARTSASSVEPLRPSRISANLTKRDLQRPKADAKIGVGRAYAPPPSEPDWLFSRGKCGGPHLMCYVAFPVMWR